MKPVSAFRARIAGRVPGILDAVIDIAVLDTCIEFCEKTLVVRGMLDTFSTVALDRDYDLMPANQQSVAKVIRVWCDNNEITPVDDDAIGNPFGFVSSVAGHGVDKGRPRYYNEVEPGVLSLYPIPDAAYVINARVALRPTRSATHVPDALFENWCEAIVNGSLARLMMQPGEAMNPKLASLHQGLYVVEVNKALLAANRGNTRAQSTVRPVHI